MSKKRPINRVPLLMAVSHNVYGDKSQIEVGRHEETNNPFSMSANLYPWTLVYGLDGFGWHCVVSVFPSLKRTLTPMPAMSRIGSIGDHDVQLA